MKQFGVQYEIDTVEYFDSEDIPPIGSALGGGYRLSEMALEHPPEELDSVLGFCGEYTPGLAGIAYSLGDYALVFPVKGSEEAEVVQHELSHNLGTIDHPYGHPLFLDESVMSYLDNYTADHDMPHAFDKANAARITANKDRARPSPQEADWKKLRAYIATVPEARREALKKALLIMQGGETSMDAYSFILEQEKKHPNDVNVQYAAAKIRYDLGKDVGGDAGKKSQLAGLARMKEIAAMDFSKTPGGANTTKAGLLNDYAWYTATELETTKESLESALSAAQEAVKLEPDNDAYLDTLGVVLHKAGKADDALAPLLKARDIIQKRGPKARDRDILHSLLKIQKEKKEYDGFRATYDLIIKADPYDGVELNNYAWALCDTFGKDHEAAIKLAKESVEWAGEKDFNKDTLGWALHLSGKSGEALEHLLAAADLNVKEAMAYEQLSRQTIAGLAAIKPDRNRAPEKSYLERIAAAYRTALRDDAQAVHARKTAKDGAHRLTQLVTLYLRDGKELAKAAAAGDDALTLDPETSGTRFACARANQRHGLESYGKNEYAAAVPSLERAVEVGATNDDFKKNYLKPTYSILADCYRKLGRIEDAERAERAAKNP